MQDPDDIPGAEGPPPEIRVNVGYLNLLIRFAAALAVIACLIATQACVWLKLQARATEHARIWIETENLRDPEHRSRNLERDNLAERIYREFPLSHDERVFIASSGWTPGPMTLMWPLFLLAMIALRKRLQKTTMKRAAKAPLIAAAIGAVLGSVGAIATFGPLLI